MLEQIDKASGGAAFGIVAAENHAADPAVDNGAGAHGAGFLGDIKIAVCQAPVFHGAFGLGEREHFRVGGGVFEGLNLVPCPADDVAFPDNDGTDGNFVEAGGFLREAEGFVHVVGVHGGINQGGGRGGVVFGLDHGVSNERAPEHGARILPGAAGNAVKG